MKIYLYKSNEIERSTDFSLNYTINRTIKFFTARNMYIYNKLILNKGVANAYKTIYKGQLNEYMFPLHEVQKRKIKFMRGVYFLVDNIWQGNYAHATHQMLLAALHFKKCKLFDVNVAYVAYKMPKFCVEMLKYSGIKNVLLLEMNTTYVFESCVFSGLYYEHYCMNEYSIREFESIATKIINYKKIETPTEFYITRRNTPRRIAINEYEVFKYMRKNNIRIFDLQGMSVEDQIRLFASAEKIIAHHGASGANLVYTLSDFCFVEFFSEAWISPYNVKVIEYKNCYYSGFVNKITGPSLSPISNYHVDIDLLDYAIKNPICYCNKAYSGSIYPIDHLKYINVNDNNLDEMIENLVTMLTDSNQILYYAKSMITDGDVKGAICTILRGIAKNPNDFSLRKHYARILHEYRLYDDELKFLLECVDIFPKWGYAYVQMAKLYKHFGKYTEARIFKDKALQLDVHAFDK